VQLTKLVVITIHIPNFSANKLRDALVQYSVSWTVLPVEHGCSGGTCILCVTSDSCYRYV